MERNFLGLILLLLLAFALIAAIVGAAKNSIQYVSIGLITTIVVIFIYVAAFILR